VTAYSKNKRKINGKKGFGFDYVCFLLLRNPEGPNLIYFRPIRLPDLCFLQSKDLLS
jgi:hypothetical protein